MLDTLMQKRVNKLLEDLNPNIQITSDEAWQQFQETMLSETVAPPPAPIITRRFAASAYSVDEMSVPEELLSLVPPVATEMPNQTTTHQHAVTREPGSFATRAKQLFTSQRQSPGPFPDREIMLSVLCQIGIYNKCFGCSPSQNELIKKLHSSSSRIQHFLNKLLDGKLILGNITTQTLLLQELAYNEFPELHAMIEENSSTIATEKKASKKSAAKKKTCR